MRITFLDTPRGSWKAHLGYDKDTLLRDYPCVVRGTLADVNTVNQLVRCDLFTHDSIYGPPYIDIYGFPVSSFALNSYIYIYVPNIQIGGLKPD